MGDEIQNMSVNEKKTANYLFDISTQVRSILIRSTIATISEQNVLWPLN